MGQELVLNITYGLSRKLISAAMEIVHLIATLRQYLGAIRLADDSRLPPERDLAARFCVSRAVLRKALAVLEQEGHIQRQVGRGTFVVQNGIAGDLDGQNIAKITSPHAAMQARSMIEPELARLAALNATSAQFAEMRELCAAMRNAPTWEDYAELDWCFHNLIAEATGNVLLVEIQRLLNGVRRYVVWGNLVKNADGPPANYHSFDEHLKIVEAIASRDPDRALQAMRAHLAGTRSQMFDTVVVRDLVQAN